MSDEPLYVMTIRWGRDPIERLGMQARPVNVRKRLLHKIALRSLGGTCVDVDEAPDMGQRDSSTTENAPVGGALKQRSATAGRKDAEFDPATESQR